MPKLRSSQLRSHAGLPSLCRVAARCFSRPAAALCLPFLRLASAAPDRQAAARRRLDRLRCRLALLSGRLSGLPLLPARASRVPNVWQYRGLTHHVLELRYHRVFEPLDTASRDRLLSSVGGSGADLADRDYGVLPLMLKVIDL